VQRRFPQLDGLRGIAILLVIFHNESRDFPFLHVQTLFTNGWMGVDLFFVLSGFLITGILLDTKETESYFKNFYARRCLRIWPLYYVCLLFMFVLVPLLSPSLREMIFARSSPWWSYPFYLQNFFGAISAGAAGLLGVTWSLAIEEQFYLVWPLVVRFCSTVVLQRIAVTVVCAAPLLRLFLATKGVDLYSNTFCRLDGLMLGALLATVVRSESFVPAKFTVKAWLVFLIAAPLALLTADSQWIVFSLVAIASASLLYVSLYSEQKWLRWALQNRFIIYTGTISYGLYLLHKIPFGAAKFLEWDKHAALATPILLALCYGLAALSWNFLEKPFLRMKRFFEANSTPTASDRFAVRSSGR
jgi:peptidoglycan/LPS O-acetylase OafA/YrhL